MPSNKELQNLKDIANILRRDSLIMTSSAGSGHPSSCLSCAEIMSSLFFHEMSFDKKNSYNSDNDEFILSKGHAAPILYATLKRAGCIKYNLKDYRKFTSPLEGHPIPNFGWIKVATGSLGQGLSIGLGMALALKMQKKRARVYVLLGDSEVAEGSIYEAAELASHYKTNNLCAILDMNNLGQRGETMLDYNSEAYKKRFESFGWKAFAVNGHSIKELMSALHEAKKSSNPVIIIAKTVKGRGVSFIEGKYGWHGRALNQEQLSQALKEIPNPDFPKIKIKNPLKGKDVRFKKKNLSYTSYKEGDKIATREAYGRALANLAKANPLVIAIDAEVSNSTFAGEVKKVRPKQFIEAYIAEQNMISMSLGLSKKGFNVFASSFSAFLSRAHDQIRMSALSKANFTICGSHSGVSIGQDGASQMGLEDLAIFRDLPNSIIFYPSDAVSTEKLVYLAAKLKGMKYIRTTRPKTLVIYPINEAFSLGDFKVLKSGKQDRIVLIGSGITLHESLKAHEILKVHKINSSVIDLYCIKPLNIKKLSAFIKKHGGKAIVAEDHYEAGGIGEMLASALENSGIQIKSLFVPKIPHSGTPDELLDKCGINARHIAMHARVFA